ncbi:MAG TPA: beta-mannosidase, partial [Rugosimonospora sp.]|nr:beta-mannosidase [Rugosimonospora sp.]
GTGPRAARGLTDASGQPTAALREMAGFRAVLDEVAVHQCTRAPADVCIVLPSHVDSGYPFTEPLERPVALGAAEQAYVACREAGTPPGLARESQGIGADCLLYLLPSLKQLTTSGWRRLEQLAYGGATVYVSYFAGVTDNQRGPWYADADRMFGVRHQLRYGLLDPVEPGPVRLTLRDDLGNLTAGTELSFATGTDPARRAYLPVEPIEAQVLATDQAGRPALLHRSVGAGAVMFCCYPLEAMAAAAPAVNPEDTWRLYAALGHAAGAHPVVRVDQPEVLVDCLDRDDGTRFVWLVSQASTPVAVTPRTQTGLPLRDLWSGALVSTVELPPFGVRVLRT